MPTTARHTALDACAAEHAHALRLLADRYHVGALSYEEHSAANAAQWRAIEAEPALRSAVLAHLRGDPPPRVQAIDDTINAALAPEGLRLAGPEEAGWYAAVMLDGESEPRRRLWVTGRGPADAIV